MLEFYGLVNALFGADAVRSLQDNLPLVSGGPAALGGLGVLAHGAGAVAGDAILRVDPFAPGDESPVSWVRARQAAERTQSIVGATTHGGGDQEPTPPFVHAEFA